mmetsp:Transcript_5320/g.10852  ORF Transcript_5320/g.10852 Transcript_5320/m.10852 type:complete len:249 (+) Transcript_5320:491-1237(+)
MMPIVLPTQMTILALLSWVQASGSSFWSKVLNSCASPTMCRTRSSASGGTFWRQNSTKWGLKSMPQTYLARSIKGRSASPVPQPTSTSKGPIALLPPTSSQRRPMKSVVSTKSSWKKLLAVYTADRHFSTLNSAHSPPSLGLVSSFLGKPTRCSFRPSASTYSCPQLRRPLEVNSALSSVSTLNQVRPPVLSMRRVPRLAISASRLGTRMSPRRCPSACLARFRNVAGVKTMRPASTPLYASRSAPML